MNWWLTVAVSLLSVKTETSLVSSCYRYALCNLECRVAFLDLSQFIFAIGNNHFLWFSKCDANDTNIRFATAVLLPGLWLTSPAGWLPRTGISSGTLRSVIEYGLLYYATSNYFKWVMWADHAYLGVFCHSHGNNLTQPTSIQTDDQS